MNAVDAIKNKVSRGLVLDIKGNWIPIASLKTVEHNFLMHLEAGEVLYEGKWTSIKNLQTANSRAPGIGRPPAPKTDHIIKSAREVTYNTDNKAIPWTVISLGTGEQHTAPESLISVIREISPAESDSDGPSSSWENATKSQLKIIALVSSAIILLSIAVFIGIRLVF